MHTDDCSYLADMNVLYFHQHFSTPQGAAGIRSYEMAKRLVQRGHHVTMVCGSYKLGQTGIKTVFHKGVRRGMVEGIQVIEFDLRYSNSDGFLRRSATFLNYAIKSTSLALTETYDAIFTTTTPLTAGIPGIVARWLRGKTFVFEVRDLWPELPKAMGVIKNPIILGMMSLLEWMSYRSAHRLIGLSPGIVEGITKRGVHPKHVAMIPNGCDLDIFKENRKPVRYNDVGQAELLAVFSGSHGIANGLHAVLDAAAVLKKRNRVEIKLLLIGDGKQKAELMARAQKEDLDNILFADPVSKEQLAGILSGADLGMQILANIPAFYYGTSPNKFFDYIASGLPVLVNYPGWLAEIIEQYGCGFVVPPDDPEAFADALEHALNNKGKLLDMAKNSSSLALNRFERRKLADEWVDWLDSTLVQN